MPKGVPRTHNHWLSISYAHLRCAGIQRGERLLNPFPLINMAAIGGCFMSWLHSAGTLVLHHPLDLGVYLRQIAEEKPPKPSPVFPSRRSALLKQGGK